MYLNVSLLNSDYINNLNSIQHIKRPKCNFYVVNKYFKTSKKSRIMLSTAQKRELKKTIKKARSLGYSDAEIRQKLIALKYPENYIDQLLKKPINLKPLIILGIIIVLAVIFTSVIFFSPFSKTCKTQDCFITAANNCESATYTTSYETLTLKLSTKDCIFTKKVTKVESSEPQDVIDLFKNKELTCQYQKNQFNLDWLTTMSKSLNNCQGSLKDAISVVV